MTDLGLSQGLYRHFRAWGADVNRLLGVTVPTVFLMAVHPSISCFRRRGRGAQYFLQPRWLAIGLPPFDSVEANRWRSTGEFRCTVHRCHVFKQFVSLNCARRRNVWRALAPVGGETGLTVDDVDAGTIISGRLELDISAWADTQARFRSENSGLPTIAGRDFSVDRLALGETDFGAFSSTGQYGGGLTSLGLVGDFIKAQIDFDGPEAQLNIQITHSLSIHYQPSMLRRWVESDNPAAAAWLAMQFC